ncbi:MAG: TIGR01777 family oxidoreductase [Thermodesulfobacteriota bacterium]
MPVSVFEKHSRIDVPVETLFSWHTRPGAIERLTPPWAPVKLVYHSGGIEQGAKVKFILRFLKVPFAWEAEHISYEENRLFKDRQVKGPFSQWTHTHMFLPYGKSASVMKDRVEFELPLDLPGGPFRSFVEKELARIFAYRHRVLKNDLAALQKRPGKITVLVSGGSGVIGSRLIPFLRAGGHRVIQLVRRRPDPDNDEIFWNPDRGELELDAAGPVDAVINLNGSNIAKRWTENRRKRIVSSRIQPTALIAEKISKLACKPSVFLTSSAVGFYGDRKEENVAEGASKGSGFVSKVCDDWETAAQPAADAGVRTCFLRIGIVLTPEGGVLSRMIPFFNAGLGVRVGSGKQFMSWISMDDTLGAIHHALFDDRLSGPLNLTAPAPVQNRVFASSLSTVLSRPSWVMVPENLVKLLWGEMGEEVLLSGAAVMPEKLLNTGYCFIHQDIRTALCDVLGRPCIDTRKM